MTHRTMSERSYHIATSLHQNVSHHQNTLTAQSGGITAKWTKRSLTSLSDSTSTWSYSLKATKNIMDVTFSKQWIHFLLSDRWPPTSTILKAIKGKRIIIQPSGRKEGNVLFNDALNTFPVIWRQTYG